jgi:hypothetical protein
MLTNSRDIKRRLEQEGWVIDRITGSHHVFKPKFPGLKRERFADFDVTAAAWTVSAPSRGLSM